jgi:5-methylcytosine-specific restriction endonuclease McrA|nr:MAG TPA: RECOMBINATION ENDONUCLEASE VII [Caudoviricetes sp.]DAZ67743.1 MAG TPA: RECOMBINATION ENDONUCLEASE VII [Caudoviricetes sp.]
MNNKDILKQYDEIKRRKLTKEERLDIYNKYNGRCGYCGEKIDIKDMQVDHIVALRVGGTDTLDNMICSCRSCNHYKSTYTLEIFKKQLQEIPNKLLRDSAIFRIALRYGLIEIKDKEIEFYFKEYKGE